MTSLRQLIQAPEILVAPGAYDAITARVIERHGFPAVYMTGAGTVNAHLGLPDISLGTMTEMVENAARIAAVIDVPLICDADTGYGNAVNVMRTVRAYEQVGVAAVHLEDQVLPKRCGHLDGKQLVPVDEMVGKIAAALAARSSDDFLIIARVDAAAVEGFEAAVRRAEAYAAAGADVIFTEAMTTREDFERFVAADVGAPLLANMTEFGKTPYLSVEEFGKIGYSSVIFPMAAFRLMLKAVDDGMAELARTGTQRDMVDRMRTRQELYDIVDYPAYDTYEAQYVRDVRSE